MKRFFLPLALLLLTGAGCLGQPQNDISRDGGVFKSGDYGQTFAQMPIYPTAKSVGSIATADVITLTADPGDHLAYYVGTSEKGMIFTIDGAATWQSPRDNAMREGTITSIAVDPGDVCNIFSIKGQRLYKSVDCARSFKNVFDETRNGVSPTVVAVEGINQPSVYLGLSNGDVVKSMDRGNTWQTVLSAAKLKAARYEVRDILISRKDTAVLLVGTRKGVFRSTDAGATWVELEDQLDAFRKGDEINRFVQDKDGNVIVMAARFGLLRTRDQGQTWEAVPMLTSAKQVLIRALAMDVSDANKLYYATADTLYRTTNGGKTWDTVKVPSSRAVTGLAVDKEDPKTLYMSVRTIEKK